MVLREDPLYLILIELIIYSKIHTQIVLISFYIMVI